jgi:hypothetical protein
MENEGDFIFTRQRNMPFRVRGFFKNGLGPSFEQAASPTPTEPAGCALICNAPIRQLK